jgi:hypothetical protein
LKHLFPVQVLFLSQIMIPTLTMGIDILLCLN